MTPADYLATVVLPTLVEFNDEPADPRRAYLACITTAHMVDHVAIALDSVSPDKYAVRQKVRRQIDVSRVALAIIEGVSNGTKHASPESRGSFKFVPGLEQRMEPYTLDAKGGLEDWRWKVPGLAVRHEHATYFIDDCVKVTVWSFADAYPALFGSVDHSPVTILD